MSTSQAQERPRFNAPSPEPRSAIGAPLPLAVTPRSVEADSTQSLRFLPPNPQERPSLAAIDQLTRAAPLSATAMGEGLSQAEGCFADLVAAGAVFERRGRHEGAGVCGIDNAVSVSSIAGVDLQPSALLACPTAVAFARFLNRTVTPLAREHFGTAPSRTYVAASYACRTRNHQSGAVMSEHSFGRAIDIRAFDFEQQIAGSETREITQWSVRPRNGSNAPEARFQTALREAACGPFKTVLGPGSDGHHADHLHLDIAQRRSTFCR
ncbi:MAG: extensin family protein [Pseudomonadota bacterium]